LWNVDACGKDALDRGLSKPMSTAWIETTARREEIIESLLSFPSNGLAVYIESLQKY
jgi:hypothetical protein